MTAFDYRGTFEMIDPDTIGFGTSGGINHVFTPIILTQTPWVLPIFCFIGIIAMVVVYSYAELVWCKEKPHAKKN